VEVCSELGQIARANARRCGLRNITVIEGDVLSLDLRTVMPRADVVIMEMLDTGLIAEQQSQAMSHLHEQEIIRAGTRIIPSRMDSYIELVNYDFDFYGLDMRFPLHARNYGANKRVTQILTTRKRFESVDFSRPVDERVRTSVTVSVHRAGLANAVRLKSKIMLSPTVALWGTSDMCVPAIVPIRERRLAAGQRARLSISYSRGRGLQQVQVSLRDADGTKPAMAGESHRA